MPLPLARRLVKPLLLKCRHGIRLRRSWRSWTAVAAAAALAKVRTPPRSSCGRGMTWTLTTSPIRLAAAAPASTAALTAATSPATKAVTRPLPILSQPTSSTLAALSIASLASTRATNPLHLDHAECFERCTRPSQALLLRIESVSSIRNAASDRRSVRLDGHALISVDVGRVRPGRSSWPRRCRCAPRASSRGGSARAALRASVGQGPSTRMFIRSRCLTP